MSNIKYKAFISYSHDDEAWAQWLHRSLEKYRVPRHLVKELGLSHNRLGTLFRDREELAASSSLSDTIRNALAASENLIVICSRISASSPWVEREVQAFIEMGGREKIFCIVVDGVPNDPRRECLPPTLRSTDGTEPLGADLLADGKRHSLDRIAAGLLGKNFGAFTQRLHRHRQARLASISAMALIGLAITTALAGLAYVGQKRAEQESARAMAIRRFMEDVMLAPDPLGEEGKDVTVLDALDRSVSEVYRVFAEQPDSQAAALNSIGRVYLNLGRYAEAEPLLDRALSLRTDLFGPDHEDVAETHDLLGKISKDLSQYEESESHYTRAIAIREKLLGHEAVHTIASKLNLISLWTTVGRYEDANGLAAQLESEQIRAIDESTYLSYRDTIGTLEWSQGNYDAAAAHFESYLDVTRKVYGEGHPFVGSAQNNLAVVYENTGRTEDAKSLLRSSLDIYLDALGEDHQDVAAAHLNLAVLLDTNGELGIAKEHYREALRIDRLQFGDRSFQAATDMINYGPILCSEDRDESGLNMVIQAQEIFEELLAHDHWRIGNAHRWRGDCLKSLGRYSEAEWFLESALERTVQNFGEENYRTEKIREALADLREDRNGEQSEH